MICHCEENDEHYAHSSVFTSQNTIEDSRNRNGNCVGERLTATIGRTSFNKRCAILRWLARGEKHFFLYL